VRPVFVSALGVEPVTEEEFEQAFGHLPTDGEG
jgi:hypothetical protein